jgi:hypothetical protein
MSMYLENAKNLIEKKDAYSLRHACLELRMAIELHVYIKLNFYSRRHGTKLIYKKWQPNKALKILCQLEPRADKSYTLHIAKEVAPNTAGTDFKKIGTHEALSVSWLNKHYNKLGSYLHLSNTSAEEPKPDTEYIKTIIQKLELVEKNALLSNFSKVIDFNCLKCETKITCCEDALPSEEIFCPNDECNGCYSAENNGDEWKFFFNGSNFPCPECNFINFIVTTDIELNANLQCFSCKTQYKIVGNNWNIAKLHKN